ncbi:MAG: hypothetical protein K9K67_12230 [Bacteriovoracaceae bacterium]|nr:hypothetical protein [Bacteriovoracaceae bacterium]
MKAAFSFFIFGIIFDVSASRLCEVYSWMACPDAFSASRSNTSASLPLNSAAGPTNPASMSTDRGFGLETLKFGNSYDVSIISGTGVIGSSFSLSNNEGTFFGERPPENEFNYIVRELGERKYKSPKFTSLFAAQLLGDKKGSSFKLNLGILAQYNKNTKAYKGGLGISAAYGPVSIGAARFKNDHFDTLNLQAEDYFTNSFTFGFKVASMAFDWTYIKNDATNWSRVRLVTATLFTKKFMFTYSFRQEESRYPTTIPPFVYNEAENQKFESFLGIQYSLKKSIILGVFSNYYLLDSLTIGLTIFI